MLSVYCLFTVYLLFIYLTAGTFHFITNSFCTFVSLFAKSRNFCSRKSQPWGRQSAEGGQGGRYGFGAFAGL